jgi:predicted RNA-binding Zn-ribbon protein involved in translation (DUF1610 family)
MPTVKLKKANVMTPTSSKLMSAKAPVVRGKGDTDYVCAGCDTVVAKSVHQRQVSNVCIQCPDCGTLSFMLNVT